MVEESNSVQHLLHDQASTLAWLEAQSIAFTKVEHTAVMTIPEMLEAVKFEGDAAKTKFAKNLFLYDKKKKERMWLVIAAHDTQIDMKQLTKDLKVGSGNLRGGSVERMEEVLGAKKGAVCLFSLINDSQNLVTLVMDKRLMGDEFDFIGYHPMVNTATLSLSREAQQKIIEISKHEPQIYDFSSAPAEVEPVQAKGAKAPKKEKPAKKEKKNEESKQAASSAPCGDQRGIEYKKETNFSKWYSQVITKAELIEYYEISGCYILRPSSFYIWEQIQAFMDSRIKELGVQNAYFPMFVSKHALEKEANHIEGFAPEVAWVTKSGTSDLSEPVAIRPTSETIMYPAFAKWIRSHRDLPLKVNQWTNVVRWEFKHPTPFIRTREFLWQEGHTAHATKEGAVQMMLDILEIYAKTYEELLAVPVVRGRKSEDERFAGADDTSTVELYVPVSGRGIQGATSHHLGQNFSKMFEVMFEDEDKVRKNVWQTSWGLSTRSIGSMIMIHSDDTGLVLPPKVAQTQIVIVPIRYKNDDPTLLNDKAEELAGKLRQAGMRVVVDSSETHNPGFKFAAWEVKGIPARLELGMKDYEKEEVRVAVRHSNKKFQAKWENIEGQMSDLLQTIHNEMYAKAEKARNEHLKSIDNWEDFMEALNSRNICLADWCDTVACETAIKDRSKEESLKAMEDKNEDEVLLTGSAKTLCIPYKMGRQASSTSEDPFKDVNCFYCGKQAKVTALWGRSY